MSYVLDLWSQPSIPIQESTDLFPVRRVLCVAKNYDDHIREMGGDPQKIKPKFFSKWADSVISGVDAVEVPFPRATENLHYEVELVVCLGKDAKIFGYGVGIDFTKRDLQNVAKEAGMPWDTSKNFAGAAAISQIVPIGQTGEITSGAIRLSVNGEVKQDGDLSQMIYNVEEIMQHLEGYDALMPGDVIFTGTPSGVGAVKTGDVMLCAIDGLPDFTVTLT
jgi:fumarylpyruvate hydrolase